MNGSLWQSVTFWYLARDAWRNCLAKYNYHSRLHPFSMDRQVCICMPRNPSVPGSLTSVGSDYRPALCKFELCHQFKLRTRRTRCPSLNKTNLFRSDPFGPNSNNDSFTHTLQHAESGGVHTYQRLSSLNIAKPHCRAWIMTRWCTRVSGSFAAAAHHESENPVLSWFLIDWYRGRRLRPLTAKPLRPWERGRKGINILGGAKSKPLQAKIY